MMVRASSQNVSIVGREANEAEEVVTACSQDLTPRECHRTRSLGLQSPGFLPTTDSRPVFVQNHRQPSFCRETREEERHLLPIVAPQRSESLLGGPIPSLDLILQM